MKLFELLQPASPERITGPGLKKNGVLTEPDITSVHYRADRVKPGGLFVAVRGMHSDGHDYIDQALRNGAAAIVTDKDVDKQAIIARVADCREALARISARFYDFPSDKLLLIGVTGTNGKTTTAALIERILLESGIRAGAIGTENYRYDGQVRENNLTTPAAPELQAILADMAAAGITHVVMEVSSHALDQKRVDGCDFDVGVFTNLTQDHLDYHQDMDAYWNCKKLLFTKCLSRGFRKQRGVSVINCVSARGRELFDEQHGNDRISVGLTKDYMIFPEQVHYAADGINGHMVSPGGVFDFTSPLVGSYNFENILCAVGAARALGVPGRDIQAGIRTFAGVAGRLERIDNSRDRSVFVDYAHTPDALKNVLATVREITRGRLICVFGCGGERDRGKRPRMGRIASENADLVVVTSDNPRGEDPAGIIEDILAGMENAGEQVDSPEKLGCRDGRRRFLVEPDRRLAILAAVLASAPADSVVVAGKGSETYQLIKGRKEDFDDRQEARQALRELAGQSPAVMCSV
ncbi:MAG: UDP-N-acetylmuramoyl-L-alanyl-D-glutamate--2,6-diaminopimelate ligase [Desulfosudaceae bacterium]